MGLKPQASSLKSRLLDWIDSRTGYRATVDHLLNEPLPPGTGWTFTTGSVVTLLIGCQLLTGVVLSMYYVPAASLAYDSVRFIMHDLPFGFLVRGLHFWGASFLVVAAAIHMLRVFFTGSYQAPREVTWLTGLLLLLLILGFALSGYLLPWDQKAYWATTVTINVARATPVFGDMIANIMRGGPDLGGLTLGRWFSAHVFLLTHMADPVAIAPGVRTISDPAPTPVMSRFQGQAVVSYLRRMHAGATAPMVSPEMQLAATTYANIGVVCHTTSGEGGMLGPDLTHVGTRRDAKGIRAVIEDASMVYGESAMPTFKDRLSHEQISALVAYLSSRR